MSVHETRGTASGTEEVGRDVEWNVLAVDGAATNRVHTTGGTIRPSTHHDVLGSTSPRVLSEAQSIKVKHVLYLDCFLCARLRGKILTQYAAPPLMLLAEGVARGERTLHAIARALGK